MIICLYSPKMVAGGDYGLLGHVHVDLGLRGVLRAH